MSDVSHPSESSRFDEVLAEYLRRVDAGEEIDQNDFITANPDVADSLRDYFQTADQLEQLAEPTIAFRLSSRSARFLDYLKSESDRKSSSRSKDQRKHP